MGTFVNHGCNGTYNTGTVTSFTETTADLDTLAEDIDGKSHTGTSTFNPVVDRHLHFNVDWAIRDIKAGEEILDNYLSFIGSKEYWAADVEQLRKECSGEAVGEVTEYETSSGSSS